MASITQIPGYVVGTWDIDASHSTVGFSVRHMMVSKVRGRFSKFEGTIRTGDNFVDSSVEASIDMGSIDTNNEQRDGHIRSADFFDAEKYPYITFKLTGIEPVDDENFRVKGELTVKEITKPITLDATVEGRMPDPFGARERVGISARGQLNRMEFGLNWDGLAGAVPFASHTIKLEVDAEIVVKAEELAESKK